MARANHEAESAKMARLGLIFISTLSSIFLVTAISTDVEEPRLPNTSMTLGELWVYFQTWSGISTGFLIFWGVIYVKLFIIWVLWSWFFFGFFNGKNGGPYGSGYGKPQQPYYSRDLNMGIGDYLTQAMDLITAGIAKFQNDRE